DVYERQPIKRATPLPSPTRTGPVAQGRPGPGFRQNGAGLPQRRRRMPMVAPAPSSFRADSAPPAAPAASREPARQPVQPGIWLDAFTKGLNGEPIPAADAATDAPDPSKSPHHPDSSTTPDDSATPNTPNTSDKDE
ncbi:hypothetical protein JBE04_41215, partial [Streptomyces sp. PRKS01-29]|nr:hypothetical protein [Streptomyces sabulosicollis]